MRDLFGFIISLSISWVQPQRQHVNRNNDISLSSAICLARLAARVRQGGRKSVVGASWCTSDKPSVRECDRLDCKHILGCYIFNVQEGINIMASRESCLEITSEGEASFLDERHMFHSENLQRSLPHLYTREGRYDTWMITWQGPRPRTPLKIHRKPQPWPGYRKI